MTLRGTHLRRFGVVIAAGIALSGVAAPVSAHCDTLDGPVVGAARKALDASNVNLILVWVQKKDEPEIRQAFQKTLAVRKAGGEARDLADRWFFETLVRVHRLGEGAGYTGLKAGKPEPIVAAADQAVEAGRLQGISRLVVDRANKGLEKHFHDLMAKRKYKPDDVAAGRAYASAYVEYVHYVERLYEAADALAPGAERKSVEHVH